jgi:hypothetical protein
MFNFQTALVLGNGERVSLAESKKRLRDLRLEPLAELPPEIRVRELLHLALDREWIVEE